MQKLDLIKYLKFNTENQTVQTSEAMKNEVQIFEAGDVLQGDMLMLQEGKSDWTSAFTAEYNKLGLKPYTWEVINGVEDAVAKSANNFIDLIRYYEGHGENYIAKTNYKDTVNVSTYGYGLTTIAMNAIGNYKNGRVINKPDTQAKAYEQLLKYLNDITLPEIKRYLGDVKYDELPHGVKAALLDYHFKNGCAVMNKSNLKSTLQETRKTNTPENWVAVLKELVYAKPVSSKADKADNPGLYRRSLSRVILAAKDLKNYFPSPRDRAMIDKTVKEIYEAGVKCAKDNNIGTADFDRIYNNYISKNTSAQVETSKTYSDNNEENKYVVPTQMGLFSAAKTIIPEKAAEKNGIDSKELRIAVINEILRLNSIKSGGMDENGYPKVRLLEQGEQLVMPTSVKVNGKTISLNAPADWEKISVQEQIPQASQTKQTEQTPQTVNLNEEPEAGTYIVKEHDGWWAIARAVTTKGYTDHDINILAKYIEEYNNSIPLTPGLKINIPPLNGISSDDEIGEYEPVTIEDMENDLTHASTKYGNFEVIKYEYKFKKGDTVYGLAQKFSVSQKDLLKDNNLTEKQAASLDVGSSIYINKVVYTVKKGESIASIESKYGIPEGVLVAHNSKDDIKTGNKIEIPGNIYTITDKKESIQKLAEEAGITKEQLMAINDLKTDKLKKGQKILIPKIPAKKAQQETSDAPQDKTRKYFIKQHDKKGNIVATRFVFSPEEELIGKTINGKKIQSLDDIKGLPLYGKTIILNAGHGYGSTTEDNIDHGALNTTNDGTPDEYICNYDNTMRLKDKLLAKGAKVIYIQGEVHLAIDEIGKARNKGDLFISVHVNAHKTPTQDRTTFWTTNSQKSISKVQNPKSRRFARRLEKKFDDWIPKHETIANKDKFIDHGEQDYAQTHSEPLGVCGKAETALNVPSIIWEVAYMVSPKGRERLRNNKLMEDYASLVADGIVEYFNDKNNYHTVKKGETLDKIARQYGTDIETLKTLNKLTGTAIAVDDELIVPNGAKTTNKPTTASTTAPTGKSTNNYDIHTVKKGDSLISIAKKYGVTIEQIKKLNGLKNNNIQIGQKLKIKKK